MIDGLATSDPSPYAVDAAALVDAENAQTKSATTAADQAAVDTDNADYQQAVATDNTTAALNDAQALAGQKSADTAAHATYQQTMGTIAADQAGASTGAYQPTLPIIVAPGAPAQLNGTASSAATEDVFEYQREFEDQLNYSWDLDTSPPATVQPLMTPNDLGVDPPNVPTLPIASGNASLAAVTNTATSFIAQSPFTVNNQTTVVQVCFAAGTLVATQRGMIAIEKIVPGDQVLCAPENDPDGPVRWRPVEAVFHNPAHRLLHVHLQSASGSSSETGNEVLSVTPLHRFHIPGRGWTRAENLSPGELLRTPSGVDVRVTEIFDNGDVEPVFNMRVAEDHTYFVAASADMPPVLVHNEECGSAATAGAQISAYNPSWWQWIVNEVRYIWKTNPTQNTAFITNGQTYIGVASMNVHEEAAARFLHGLGIVGIVDSGAAGARFNLNLYKKVTNGDISVVHDVSGEAQAQFANLVKLPGALASLPSEDRQALFVQIVAQGVITHTISAATAAKLLETGPGIEARQLAKFGRVADSLRLRTNEFTGRFAPSGPNLRSGLASTAEGIPMDSVRFQKIKAAFERNGGLIDQSDFAQMQLLEAGGPGQTGLTLSAKDVLMRPNPTASTVFYEMIHATQFRTGRAQAVYGMVGQDLGDVVLEIEVQQRLLQNSRAWGLTAPEAASVQSRLEGLMKTFENHTNRP